MKHRTDVGAPMIAERSGQDDDVERLRSRVDALERMLDEAQMSIEALSTPHSIQELIRRVQAPEAPRPQRARPSDIHSLFAALSQAPVNINVLRGPELVFELAHPLTVKALGARPIIGKPLLEAVPELRDQDAPLLLRSVFENGRRVDQQEKLVRLDDGSGQLRDTYWSFSFLPLFDAHGHVEGVLTINIEVTEQVLARRQQEACERHFQRVVNDLNAGLAQAQLTGRILQTNERFRQIVGRTEAELRELRIQQLVYDEHHDARQFRALVEEGTPFATKVRRVKPDGSVAWLQNSLSRVEDREGQPRGVVVVALEQVSGG